MGKDCIQFAARKGSRSTDRTWPLKTGQIPLGASAESRPRLASLEHPIFFGHVSSLLTAPYALRSKILKDFVSDT